MKTNSIYIIIFLLTVSFSSISQQADTIIISPKVGMIIDNEEKVKYNIFPYYSNEQFKQAVFIRNADSSIVLKLQLEPDITGEKPISIQEFEDIKNMISGVKIRKNYFPPNRVKSRKFNLSFFTGVSIGGPRNNMESQMLASGLHNNKSNVFFSFEKGNYEQHSRKTPTFDIEATCYLYKNCGLSLNFGLADKTKVSGFEDFNFFYNYNSIILKSEIWSLSACYFFSSENKIFNFFIGPVYIIHEVTQDNYSKLVTKNKNEKIGLYLSALLYILQKDDWFITCKANYRWASKSEIGPFYDSSGKSHISEFSRTKVNLCSLNIGISVGIRVGNEAKYNKIN